MSDETAAALDVAMLDYRVTGDGEALKTAAQAHLDDSRMLETVMGEYQAVAEAMAAGEPYDAEELAALGTELSVTRQARRSPRGTCPAPGIPPASGSEPDNRGCLD